MTTYWFAICKLLKDYEKSATSFLSILLSLIITSQDFLLVLSPHNICLHVEEQNKICHVEENVGRVHPWLLCAV